MRICLADAIPLQYTAETPLIRPLGGMQSAACYLAVELSKLGHDVFILSGTPWPSTYEGVTSLNFQDFLHSQDRPEFDVMISLSTCAILLREKGVKCPLILWTGHDTPESAVSMLSVELERRIWSKFAMITNWQAQRYKAAFGLNEHKFHIVNYAAGPAFHAVPSRSTYFFETGRKPVLVYSSTPFRGLEVLLDAIPAIREGLGDCVVRIFSSMAVYGRSNKDDPHALLYRRCRETDGVEYCGSVDQVTLANEFSKADILAYPNTFMETSCISIMEAMISGLLIVSSDYGAIPETSAGFAHLCAYDPASKKMFAKSYADKLIETVRSSQRHPVQFRSQLVEQEAYARSHHGWSSQALKWEAFLKETIDEQKKFVGLKRNDACPCGSSKKFKHCCGVL